MLWIGKFDNLLPYTTHDIQIDRGDTLYIFSDGYPDQFGGEKGGNTSQEP